jgi:hypothetical protein
MIAKRFDRTLNGSGQSNCSRFGCPARRLDLTDIIIGTDKHPNDT